MDFRFFLAPPSFEELERRIRGRGTDPEEAIRRRLARAKDELAAQAEFDAVVINDELDQALKQVETLMMGLMLTMISNVKPKKRSPKGFFCVDQNDHMGMEQKIGEETIPLDQIPAVAVNQIAATTGAAVRNLFILKKRLRKFEGSAW